MAMDAKALAWLNDRTAVKEWFKRPAAWLQETKSSVEIIQIHNNTVCSTKFMVDIT